MACCTMRRQVIVFGANWSRVARLDVRGHRHACVGFCARLGAVATHTVVLGNGERGLCVHGFGIQLRTALFAGPARKFGCRPAKLGIQQIFARLFLPVGQQLKSWSMSYAVHGRVRRASVSQLPRSCPWRSVGAHVFVAMAVAVRVCATCMGIHRARACEHG